MKNKKIISALLTLTICVSMSIGHSVFAAENSDEIYYIYYPTRAQVAEFFISFLGQEMNATIRTHDHPFTDIPPNLNETIGFLYENNLTYGVTATQFAPDIYCTPQMFATFMLRMLGYSEAANDFTFEKSLEFAKEKGIINKDYLFDKITIDDITIIAANTILTKVKSEDITLLKKLEENNLITNDAAERIKRILYNEK